MKTFRRLPRGRAFTVGVATLTLAASGALVASAVTPPPAHNNNTVGLKQVGPIDEANGFPIWYKDTNNVKLELCTDPGDPYCIMGDVPDPAQPVSFPDNFPDEAFWSSAESSIDAGGGDSALLVTAVEAAFARRTRRQAATRSASAGSASGPVAWSTTPSTRSPTRTASTPPSPRWARSRASTPPRTSGR